MFERFTEPARRALFFSRAEATARGVLAIGPEHLLLALLRENGGRVGDVLTDAGLSADLLQREIVAAQAASPAAAEATDIPFAETVKRILQHSADEADRLRHPDIAPEHLLLGVLREGTSTAASLLTKLGLRLDAARSSVHRLGGGVRPAPDDVEALHLIRERLQAAENAFDAEPLVDVLTDDAVLMVPNEPTQEGKAECAAFVRRVLADQQAWFDRRIVYINDEISVRGDIGFDRGTFSFTVITRHDGRRTDASGKYFWLYTRVPSGDWQLARAIVSLDEAVPDR